MRRPCVSFNAVRITVDSKSRGQLVDHRLGTQVHQALHVGRQQLGLSWLATTASAGATAAASTAAVDAGGAVGTPPRRRSRPDAAVPSGRSETCT